MNVARMNVAVFMLAGVVKVVKNIRIMNVIINLFLKNDGQQRKINMAIMKHCYMVRYTNVK